MTTTNSTSDVGSAYLTSLQKQTSKTDSSTGAAGSALGKDAFLQLLVTQKKPEPARSAGKRRVRCAAGAVQQP